MVTMKNPGAAVITGAILLSFGAVAINQYVTNQEVKQLKPQPVVLTKTIVVTPTIAPTATPSASLKTRIYTPASATK